MPPASNSGKFYGPHPTACVTELISVWVNSAANSTRIEGAAIIAIKMARRRRGPSDIAVRVNPARDDTPAMMSPVKARAPERFNG